MREHHLLPATEHVDPAASVARRILQNEGSLSRRRIIAITSKRPLSLETQRKIPANNRQRCPPSVISHVSNPGPRNSDSRRCTKFARELAIRRDKTHHMGLQCLHFRKNSGPALCCGER